MNRIDKPKVDAAQQIKKLIEEKGVTFNIISEQDATDYIKNTNNYLRTASYRKNYTKHQKGSQEGKYINLDFAYLADLSTIDMHLRTALLKMCTDLEHSIKTKLIAVVEDNPNEDGYNIVDLFFLKYPTIQSRIAQKGDTIFTGELIEKYFKLCYVFLQNNKKSLDLKLQIEENDCPIWVLVELLSFGDTIDLIYFYNEQYPKCKVTVPSKSILKSIKNLRNACAHNNCLLNDINCRKTTPNQEITTYISEIKSIGKEERAKKLSCRPIFEIVCLLKAYNETVSVNVKKNGILRFKTTIINRMYKNIHYYEKNDIVKTSIDFLKKVIDNLP